MEMLDYAVQDMNMATPWLMPLCFALFGACIGSFLNVVIYRMPRGMKVNEPARSFCPNCEAEIPAYLNIPIISWLMLRGRSACCHQRISPRYWFVEVIHAALYALVAWHFAMEGLAAQILICLWCSVMMASFFIDWEKMVVLPGIVIWGVIAGVLTALFAPWLIAPDCLESTEGLMWSLAGAASGFIVFRVVGLLGKWCFGRRKLQFDSPCKWSLRQSGEDLELRIGEQSFLWSDLFLEESNRLCLTEGKVVDIPAANAEPGALNFRVDSLELPDGTRLELENYDHLEGTCCGMRSEKEAMGSGDAWLALAIGALCGWQGVLFSLAAGSIIGLIWALIARIGRGTPMPFGPSLILGAAIWLFCGQLLLVRYLNWCDSL